MLILIMLCMDFVLIMPEFLAKIRTHSTTWQLKTIKFVQRPIESLYLRPSIKDVRAKIF